VWLKILYYVLGGLSLSFFYSLFLNWPRAFLELEYCGVKKGRFREAEISVKSGTVTLKY
jgi:hypothetical protein